MNIKDNEVRKVINHVSIKRLSLGNIDAMRFFETIFSV